MSPEEPWVPWPEDLLKPGDGLLARPNRLDLECAVRSLVVPVRMQRWNGRPPAPAENEDLSVEEVELSLSSGTVRLWELTGGPGQETFTVGPPGNYGVQCIVVGQMAALAGESPTPDGAVEFTLNFWSAD